MSNPHTSIQAYRRLLRHVQKTFRADPLTQPLPLWKAELRSRFTKPLDPKSPSKDLSTRLARAEDVLEYFYGRQTYHHIVSKQNPSASLTELEKSSLTAARVGLRLPKAFGLNEVGEADIVQTKS
ncbi:MAG: hypothetical protein DHS80DRAFT_31670 [Piptocephalis tieghemiana]|nr:MAG: hypothetical protein DHS80DRAFT_31670 [Piptocephalis tieghemiana]